MEQWMPARCRPARRHPFFPAVPFTPVDGFVRTLDAIRLECWTGSDQNAGRHHLRTPGRLPLESAVTSRILAKARPSCSPVNVVAAAALRTVPTTRWPAASASTARERPKPELTPVMKKVLGVVLVMSDLLILGGWGGARSRK